MRRGDGEVIGYYLFGVLCGVFLGLSVGVNVGWLFGEDEGVQRWRDLVREGKAQEIVEKEDRARELEKEAKKLENGSD